MNGTAGGVTLATVPHHLHLGVLMATEQSIAERFWSLVDTLSEGPEVTRRKPAKP